MNIRKQGTNRWVINKIAFLAILLIMFNARAGESTASDSANKAAALQEEKAGAAQQDRTLCRENLLKLSAAIQAYRKDHDDLPDWLSDLVPKYLPSTNGIMCPVCVRTGARASGMPDPRVRNAYHYEFNPAPIGADVQSFWGETMITMRQWKQQQERIVGGEIPVVRCSMHGVNSLDLTLNGKVREDPLIWEQQFTTDKIKLRDLAPYPVTKPGPAQQR
jgi:hypothetical protein